MQSEMLEAIAGAGCGLRVEFVWRGDRIGHVVSLLDANGQAAPLLESIEGGASDAWPPSPPLQSLNLHALPDARRAALLVGMAGRSHWSASIETTAKHAAIVFDIACRTIADVPALQSTYRLAAHSTAAKQLGGSVHLACEAGRLRISIERDAELSIDGSAIHVRANSHLRSATRRWTYRIECELPGNLGQA